MSVCPGSRGWDPVRLGLFPQPVDVIPLPNGTTVHVMRSVTERSTLGFLCITVTSRFGDEVARFDTAHGEPHIHRGDRRDVLGAMPDNADEGASYMSEHYGTWYDTMIGIAERTDRV